ncbi:hypothetical protein BDZ89DRAFT_719816 [Hymenopellis radicata]|nr:hypothetical protein BDZ89DRAFT_719816 [Hymenopellis radicata]
MVPEHRDYLEAENEHLRFLHARAQDDIAATSSQLENSLAEIEQLRHDLAEAKDRLCVMEGARDDALHALEDAKTRLLSQTSELEDLRNEKSWRDAAHRREKELRARDVEKWGARSSSWTPGIAVDRALFMLEEFSASTFSSSSPLTFSALPWPILGDIQRSDPSDMTWSAVDDFFRYVKIYRAESAYKQMGEQMRKNFHPDRWRARNILKTVCDEELRGSWRRREIELLRQ